MADITVIILTFNEEKNIRQCIQSVKKIARRIVVVDSFSTDRTLEYAQEMGAVVMQHRFENYAKQYTYAVENANVKTKWIFRLDADERVTLEAASEIEKICDENTDTDVNGIIVRVKVNFLGKELKHGGIYPFRKLLIYKSGEGGIENRYMDEHIVLKEGRIVELKSDCLHYDFKDLTAWVDKHNKYATREVIDFFERNRVNELSRMLDGKAKIKRIIKYKIYYRLPIGTRAHLYYLYRYYIKRGFLDGKEGKIFAFLQAYWYRYLVDAKIYEAMKNGND